MTVAFLRSDGFQAKKAVEEDSHRLMLTAFAEDIDARTTEVVRNISGRSLCGRSFDSRLSYSKTGRKNERS